MSNYSEASEMKIFPMMLSSPPLGMETKSSFLMQRKPPIMRLNSTGEEQAHFNDRGNGFTAENKQSPKGVFHRLIEQKCTRKPLYSPTQLGISPCMVDKQPCNYMKELCSDITAYNQPVSDSVYTVMDKFFGGYNSPSPSKIYNRFKCKVSSSKVNVQADTMASTMTNLPISSDRTDCVSNSLNNLGITPKVQRPEKISVLKGEFEPSDHFIDSKHVYSGAQSIVVSCNSLFNTPTRHSYYDSKPTCDINNKSQSQCDDKSNSLIVHISAQCQGETKLEVNITNKDSCASSEESNFIKQNKHQCSESSKKKRKTRPSCKKRRRLHTQKESNETEKHTSQSNCAFSFVMGWSSPSKNEESCQKHLSKSTETASSKDNKFSFFISGAEFSDSSTDDGFSENEDNAESQCDDGDDVWNSFINSSDHFSPFNLQCVFHLGPNTTATTSKVCDQNETKDPVVQKNLRKANESWQKLYQAVVVPIKRNSKVQFAPQNQLESIDHIDQYCAEYAEARQGPWEQMARDRQRFQKRIQEVETAIANCLTSSHREIVFNRLYGDLLDVPAKL